MMTSIMLLAATSWSFYRFGSVGSGIDYLEGRRIVVDHPVQEIGTVRPGVKVSLVYRLTNATGHPVRILRSSTSCGCTVIGSIPEPIGRSERIAVPLTITVPDTRAVLDGEATLIVDDPDQQPIRLQY